jgi:hypothetical protein
MSDSCAADAQTLPSGTLPLADSLRTHAAHACDECSHVRPAVRVCEVEAADDEGVLCSR